MHNFAEALPKSELPHYQAQKASRVSRVGEYLRTFVIPTVKMLNAKGFHLEIGSGHGHWLTSFAQKYPNHVFLGIDLISKRVKKAEAKKERHLLKNLFFLKAEASEFLSSIPIELVVQATYIMFPDPWPKKRHHKNRLIQTNFLQELARVSSKNSKLFFRTDHKEYFDWTLSTLKICPHWQLERPHWPHESCSFFQDLFETAHTCCAARS